MSKNDPFEWRTAGFILRTAGCRRWNSLTGKTVTIDTHHRLKDVVCEGSTHDRRRRSALQRPVQPECLPATLTWAKHDFIKLQLVKHMTITPLLRSHNLVFANSICFSVKFVEVIIRGLLVLLAMISG